MRSRSCLEEGCGVVGGSGVGDDDDDDDVFCDGGWDLMVRLRVVL